MGRSDYIFGQFQETAQHGGGVCCALAPQLVLFYDVAVNCLYYFIVN